MPKPFLALLFILVTCAQTYAQKDKETKQRDSSIIIFSESPRPGKKGSKKYVSDDNNVIKIAPLGFLKGVLPVYYEKKFSDLFTLQGGVGVTTRNYIRGLVYNALDNDNTDKSSATYTWNTTSSGEFYGADEDLFNFDYRKATPGYFISLQPRLYFENEAPEGTFIALSLDHYDYRFQSQMLKGDGTSARSDKTIREYEKMNDLMVIFGWQVLYDRLSLEYTNGIGVRNIKGEKYASAYDGYGKYVDGMANYKKTTINIELSLKVGFHF
ncbi:MAG TPA: hypothetical protein VIM79_23970 [Niastella sp.]